jgi:hypothetical protein
MSAPAAQPVGDGRVDSANGGTGIIGSYTRVKTQ